LRRFAMVAVVFYFRSTNGYTCLFDVTLTDQSKMGMCRGTD
jgi:hypothetical protein